MKKKLIYCAIIVVFTVLLVVLCLDNRFYKHTINNPFNIRVTELRITMIIARKRVQRKMGNAYPSR